MDEAHGSSTFAGRDKRIFITLFISPAESTVVALSNYEWIFYFISKSLEMMISSKGTSMTLLSPSIPGMNRSLILNLTLPSLIISFLASL